MSSQKKRQQKEPPVQNYAELTVAKLKDLHRARDIRIPYNATKAELIYGLESADNEEPIMANHTKDDDNDKPKAAPAAPAKKTSGETRLFQIGGNAAEKVELTKAEAEEKGFYWAE